MKKSSSLLKKLRIGTKRKVFTEFIGSYKSSFKGIGVDFDDLREYVPGDNIKDIDWNSTAKTGDIHVRKYSEDREIKLNFVIDISSSLNWGSSPDISKKNLLLELVYYIGSAANLNNDKFGAVYFNDRVVKSIEIKKGLNHLLRIFKFTENCFADNYFNKSTLEEPFKYLLRGIKKRSLVVFITDFIDLDEKLKKLFKAAHKKHEIIVITVNDIAEIRPNILGQEEFENIETGEISKIDFGDWWTLKEYNSEMANYFKNLRSFFIKNRVGFLPINSKDDVLEKLLIYFKKYKISL